MVLLKTIIKKLHLGLLLEIIIPLAVLYFIDVAFFDGDRFRSMHYNPCWLLILLIVVQHGSGGGILAVLMCTFFLLFQNMPEKILGDTVFNYYFKAYSLPILWMLVTVTLGYLRDEQITKFNELKDKYLKMLDEFNALSKTYKKLQDLKDFLDRRLNVQLYSVTQTYNALDKANFNDVSTLPDAVLNMVQAVVDPRQWSIYQVNTQGLELLKSEGWYDDSPYKKAFTPEDQIYKKAVLDKNVLCIVNEEDEEILANEGIIAVPIMINEKVDFLLKIEKMNFMELNNVTIDTIISSTKLITNLYNNNQ